jgi:hypothetical protein
MNNNNVNARPGVATTLADVTSFVDSIEISAGAGFPNDSNTTHAPFDWKVKIYIYTRRIFVSSTYFTSMLHVFFSKLIFAC